MADPSSPDVVLNLTVQIVAAHVEHNTVAADALPGLIEQVYRTLRDASRAPTEPEKPVAAVPIRQSVKADFIVCLEDGKRLKTLRRHLMTSYNLTPAQYRGALGPAGRLSHGCTQLREGPLIACQEDRPRPDIGATAAGEDARAAGRPEAGAEIGPTERPDAGAIAAGAAIFVVAVQQSQG